MIPGPNPPGLATIGVVLAGYGFLLLTSGRVVTATLRWADETYAEDVTDEQRDIGLVVGKAENVLLLTFVLVDAFTALSIVFVAKSIVRREDMKNNSLYYFAGTVVNFTYSVVVGIGVAAVVRWLPALGG